MTAGRLRKIGGTCAFAIACAAFLSAGASPPGWEEADRPPPRAAQQYRRTAVRTWRYVFGSAAPTPLLAAQIEQESAWNPDAESPYAQGLAQFTPVTAKQMGAWYPRELKPANSWNPDWALMAQAKYMKRFEGYWIMRDANTECDLWAFALSAYNGGLGNLKKDVYKAAEEDRDTGAWFGERGVADVRTRAEWAQEENREYPVRIMRKQAKYSSWGGTQIDCRGRF